VLLVYGLAVDPKPRMFLLAAAVAALVISWATIGFVRRGLGTVPVAVVVLLLTLGAVIITRLPNTKAIEAAAKAWITAHPGAIESDPRTIGALTLLPEARALPPVGSGRPLRLVLTTMPCAVLAGKKATVIAERRSAAASLCLVNPTKD